MDNLTVMEKGNKSSQSSAQLEGWEGAEREVRGFSSSKWCIQKDVQLFTKSNK